MTRFTDAELAAEVHHAELVCWVRRNRCDRYSGETALWNHYERGIEQSYTLHRFATLPHYDEAAS